MLLHHARNNSQGIDRLATLSLSCIIVACPSIPVCHHSALPYPKLRKPRVLPMERHNIVYVLRLRLLEPWIDGPLTDWLDKHGHPALILVRFTGWK